MKLMRRLTLSFSVLFIAVAVAAAFVPQSTHAAVGTGNGSAGSGCSGGTGPNKNGCPYTTNGTGWFKIAVGASNAPTGNSYWSTASPTCRNEGSTHVIAFVIFTGEKTLSKGWIYKFQPKYDNGPYVGNISKATAAALFNTVPASQRSGYTYGGVNGNVGWFCYDESKDWKIRAESYIQPGATANRDLEKQGTITVTPGTRLNWYHDMRNQGPDGMDKKVSYRVDKSGFSNNWNTITSPSGSASGGYNALFVTIYATNNASYMKYDVTQDDVGHTLCQSISWEPKSSSDNKRGSSTAACASVPYNYTLTPSISNITDNSSVEAASGVKLVQARVVNSGATKSHSSIQWQITQIRYKAGVTIAKRSGGVSSSNPCAYFTGNTKCTSLKSGTKTGGYVRNASVPYDTNGDITDEQVGTQLCFAMSVKRNSSSSADWRHSELRCLIVGKKPKVDILGGDLYVGRKPVGMTVSTSARIITSHSKNATGTYGSWAEYGIVAAGPVTSMASGSGYVGGMASDLNLLTFVTKGCGTTVSGCYTYKGFLPDIASRFPTTSSSKDYKGEFKGGSLAGMTGVYSGKGTLSIAGGTIQPGQWVVINAPTANVTIDNSIQYANGPFTSASQIPQLVIIAKSITISDVAERVDAWLIAPGTVASSGAVSGGVIRTCSTAPSAINAGTCSKKLVVNGPIMANKLSMLRTNGAGVGTDSGTPAEVFNFRPDAYLWALSKSESGRHVVVTATKELPPRY